MSIDRRVGTTNDWSTTYSMHGDPVRKLLTRMRTDVHNYNRTMKKTEIAGLLYSEHHPRMHELMLRLENFNPRSILTETFSMTDDYRSDHDVNMAWLTKFFVEYLRKQDSSFKKIDLDAYIRAAIDHDIGKTQIDDSVLDKAGKLNSDDCIEINGHAPKGAQILRRVGAPDLSYYVAEHHHTPVSELKILPYNPSIKNAINMLIVLDKYCACREKRPYKPALDHNTSNQKLNKGISHGLVDLEMVALFRDFMVDIIPMNEQQGYML